MSVENKKIYRTTQSYKTQTKLYYQINRDKIRAKQKQRRESGITREYMKQYKKKRKENDLLYKTTQLFRDNVIKSLKRMGYRKGTKTHNILGAEYEIVKKHIESQFLNGMSWDNHGKNGWHLDHIIPISSAKNEEELIKLCNYNNLQPLWEKDNVIKSNKVPLVSKLY